MIRWTTLKDFVDQMAGGGGDAESLDAERLKLATAALLVRAGVIDGRLEDVERATLMALLQAKFDLEGADADRLVRAAEAREREAIDLYRFTSELTRQLGQDGRQRIVEMLWEVVVADGVVDEFEANLVWRVAELLGVSSRDRIRLRKQVEARAARPPAAHE